MRLTKTLHAAALILALASPIAAQDRPNVKPMRPAGEACVITAITDGDSFRCKPHGKVRLLSIDTPELSQAPYGRIAQRYARKLMSVGDTVRLEFDVARRDRYRRTLAYAYLKDGRMVNKAMIDAGFAVVYVLPPNVKHVKTLRAAAASARQRRAGFWSNGGFDCLPADFRRGRCKQTVGHALPR